MVRVMTCREVSNLLPPFFDGELDARQMRAVALHTTRCPLCETALRELERLQEAISTTINAHLDEVDLSSLWPAVERQLGTHQISWWQRLRARWQNLEPWDLRVPVLAAAALAVLALLLFARAQPAAGPPAAPQLAEMDSAATIEKLDTDAESVEVVNDPETPVLWVSDDTSGLSHDTSVGDVP